jgi:ornithine decarboxylase
MGQPALAAKPLSAKLERFLQEARPTPFLALDLDMVESQYQTLQTLMPTAQIYYAVKANPARPILERLQMLGSSFDVASPGEIEACLAAGVPSERISYSNTVKKASAIAYAYQKGIRLYALDSEAELEKIAQYAPGSRVMCRLLTQGEGATWPLNRKFGCDPEMAFSLMVRAKELGLEPYGLAFHVGSQMTNPGGWEKPIAEVAKLWARLEKEGVYLKLVNMGGGLPATYRESLPDIEKYLQRIQQDVHSYLGHWQPQVMLEPGRFMVGDAGVTVAEVVLIARKSPGDPVRWVFLDVGKYGGISEAIDGVIHFRIRTDKDGGLTGPVVLAGPTCDSHDTMYESWLELPLNLEIGDRVYILSTGAYSANMSTVSFNGFEPLRGFYL